MPDSPRTVVVGLGNPVRADDGVGLAVARELRRLLEEAPVDGVVVRTSERAGFEILDLLDGVDRAVIVDCVEATSRQPGRARLFSASDVRGSARLVGGHDISVGSALELGRLLDLDMPDAVEIVGIEAEDTTSLQETLTPAVARAVPLVARWLHRRLANRPSEP